MPAQDPFADPMPTRPTPIHAGKQFYFKELGGRFRRLWKYHPPRIQWDFTYLRQSTQADPICRGKICHWVIFRLFR